MRFLKIGILIIIICLFIPAGLFAQAGGFSAAVDLRTGFNLFGIVPGIPAIIGVPLSISEQSITISPQFGFLYYFDVLTDLHDPYFIPLGASVIYNPLKTGLDLLYYVPAAGTIMTHMVSAAVVSEAELVETGRFSLLLEMKLGSMFVLDPANPGVFLMLNTVIIPRFKF